MLVPNPAADTFTQAGGTLSVASTGTFANTGGLFLVQGGTVSGQVEANGGSLQLASSITAPTTITVFRASTTLVSNDAPMGNVLVQGGSAQGAAAANLTLASGAANLGTITLQPAGTTPSGGPGSNLIVATGTTFVNAGTIQVNAGGGITSTLTGNFTNQGTFNVGADATLLVPNPAGETFTQAGGTLSVASSGTFATTGGLFLVQGGTVSGPVEANGGSLQLASSITAPTTITVVRASTTLVSNDAPMGTVLVEGGSASGAAAGNLTLASGAANLGTITLQPTGVTPSGGPGSSLIVATGTTFVNAGTIQVNAGVGITSTLTGNFTNQGTFNVGAGATLLVPNPAGESFTQAGGTLSVTSSGTFATTGGLFLVQGGTVSGPVEANGGSLQLASSITAPTTITVFRASTTLVSNDAPKGTVLVQGAELLSGTAPANLTLASGAANMGTITLQPTGVTPSGGPASNLIVATGTTFVNAGTIQVNAGVGITSTLTGNFTNQGTFNVGADATLLVTNPAGQTFTQAGGTLSANSSGTFANNGGLFLVQGGRSAAQVEASKGGSSDSPTPSLCRPRSPCSVRARRWSATTAPDGDGPGAGQRSGCRRRQLDARGGRGQPGHDQPAAQRLHRERRPREQSDRGRRLDVRQRRDDPGQRGYRRHQHDHGQLHQPGHDQHHRCDTGRFGQLVHQSNRGNHQCLWHAQRFGDGVRQQWHIERPRGCGGLADGHGQLHPDSPGDPEYRDRRDDRRRRLYDQVKVTGLASLDGALDVTLINGVHSPRNAGNAFQVLSYSPHSGQFASVALENFPSGLNENANYTANNLSPHDGRRHAGV